jgi:hypothetical protein
MTKTVYGIIKFRAIKNQLKRKKKAEQLGLIIPAQPEL